MEENDTLLTDLYQLTMGAAYLDNNKAEDYATFDLFVRKLPEDWGYFIANGIEDAIDYLTDLKFEQDDLDYLRGEGIFNEPFLDFLKGFRFQGEVYAVKEGTPIFPGEAIARVTAKRPEAQYIESKSLLDINFPTMIASKASRTVNASKKAKVVDFGLRRAQGRDAAMKGARAAYIGGAVATSNVKAGKVYGIPLSGTHAHSFVMGFPTELEAFRAYVKTFPDKPTLLIDTYDTIQGARNAAIVAKELEGRSKQLGAVRLDSGDLCDLAKKVRQIFDERGLNYVKILASNDLNEYKIEDLLGNGAPIDGFGVGTEMITAKPVSAIGGVYKLVEDDGGGKIKLSPGKKTLPGMKQIYRQTGKDGLYEKDIIALDYEKVGGAPLLELVVQNGKRIRARPALEEIRNFCLSEVAKLPAFLRELRVKEHFRIDISEGLNNMVDRLTQKYSRHFFSDEKVYKEHYTKDEAYKG